MAAASTEPSYVKLQTENINLKDTLDAARRRLQELEDQTHAAQAKATVLENQMKATDAKRGNADNVFEQRITELEDQVQKASAAKQHAEDTLKSVTKEGETNKRNLAELLTLRKQVEDHKKREKTMQQVIDELNQRLDKADLSPSPSSGALNSEDIEKRIEVIREELERKAEEEMYAMTLELEETIEKKDAEIVTLKQQLSAQPPPTAAPPTNASPTKPGDVSAVERALAEKAIALRVKDGAIAECGQLRAELDKTAVVIKDLKAQVELLERQLKDARSQAASPSKPVDPASNGGQADDSAAKMLKAQIVEKDKLVKYLQDRVSDLEVRVKSAENERDAATETKSVEYVSMESQLSDLTSQLEKLHADHAAELERVSVDYQIVCQERDKAMAAGRKAFLERNTALNEAKAVQKKEQLLAKLKKDAPGGSFASSSSNPNDTAARAVDRSSAENVLRQVEQTYDDIVGKIEQTSSPDERRDVMFDKLFEYEHKIWNLNNDLESLHAIRKIREEEATQMANSEWAARCEEYMSCIEILRMQIRELGKEPLM